MTAHTHTKEFDLTHELHQTIVKSLTTSFGLDFLLFEDRKGGDVDTIHKVREYQKDLQNTGQSDIHISNNMRAKLTPEGKNFEKYDSHAYHSNTNYIQRGKTDKIQQQQSQLYDDYRNTNMKINEKRQLDHIISASEIHHDAGRILADADGVILANQDENLSSTLGYINNKKSDMSVQEFIKKLPKMKQQKKDDITKDQAKFAQLHATSPKEYHEKQKLDDKIQKEQEHLKALESVDTKNMLKKDQTARQNYNKTINNNYYSSSKFLHATAQDMSAKGLAMGTRQAVGLMLAEIWFELREQIPHIYRKCCVNFQLSEFMSDIGQAIKNIWERVKSRFKDMLAAFKDGVIAGALASLTTTIFNAFTTISGRAIKIIRESWNSLVQAFKLLVFNPKKLSTGEKIRELTRILGSAAAIAAGTIVDEQMRHLLSVIPLDFIRDGLSAFVGALITGLLTVGLTYFLDHSEIMKKLWHFIDSLNDKYKQMVENYKEINAELDRYLIELSKIEFNMNSQELIDFSNNLMLINNEYDMRKALSAEIQRRNIELPFEMGNTNSTRAWLASKMAKK